jgi:hypothetical protein
LYVILHIIANKHFPLLNTYALPIISGYFAFISILTYSILTSQNIDSKKYISMFILTTGIKFIFHLIIILILALINRTDAIGTIISFGIFYIILTSLETSFLLRKK